MAEKSKLIIISTRLPISVSKVNGKLKYTQSSGGLATGVSSISKKLDSIWIGWPGIASDELSKKEKIEVINELKKHKCHPVFLNSEQVDNYYSGYCNATLWPLFHYFTDMSEFNPDYWESYKRVNELFCKETRQFVNDNDNVWVHDYQLMLLPNLLRQKFSKALIGFFLHTPFPSYEIFRIIPEREELLNGLLGADLVGFHTYDYVRHFLSSTHRLLGHESDLGRIQIDGRTIQADAFPIGIDYKKFSKGSRNRNVKSLIKSFELNDKRSKVILSVDRADYSKGIPSRLDAYELFLEQNPKYHGNVTLVLLAVPSREYIQAYIKLRKEIEQKVSRINGKYSTINWSPIHYHYQSLPFNEVTALYATADIMLVTPLRDGMNLVAKEYVATRHKKEGVLILSEMTGVATELTEAVMVNPRNYQMVADAIVKSLEMPKKEQKKRISAMQERISSYTITKWAEDYIYELSSFKDKFNKHLNFLEGKNKNQLIEDYKDSKKRLILLDYDGTLKEYVSSYDEKIASPTKNVRKLIKRLTNDKKNKVVIVSGRPKNILETFFENKGLGLVAEHGGWLFEAGHWVKSNLTPKKWKKGIKPILQQFTARTPGAQLEEKDFSLVWHYRNVAPDLAYVRREELKAELSGILGISDVNYYEGEKIIEIKPRNMHKGTIVTELVDEGDWDFILCMGDDYTDEDMFRALPERAFTVHVGNDDTEARFRVHNVKSVINLLQELK